MHPPAQKQQTPAKKMTTRVFIGKQIKDKAFGSSSQSKTLKRSSRRFTQMNTDKDTDEKTGAAQHGVNGWLLFHLCQSVLICGFDSLAFSLGTVKEKSRPAFAGRL
jgi:hypothetical protein